MKRRDFILGSAGLATGTILPAISRGQSTPCPVPELSAAGGTTATAACVNGATAESDWIARSVAPGVVWCHDFRNQAEIDQFRWVANYGGGNDPTGAGQIAQGDAVTSVYRQASDGVTGGGCLEMLRPAGTRESQATWWRMFSPLSGTDNGRGIDDPGANGTIPLSSYSPSDRGSEISNWTGTARPGYYGHSDYHSGTKFDGDEFWLQMRVKMDPRRTSGGNESSIVGKLTYLTLTSRSLTGQEIVTYSNGGYYGSTNYHRIYTAGSPTLEQQDSLGRPGQQVGGELSDDYAGGNYCDVTNQAGQAANCWAYSGGWDTLLYHIIPGHDSTQDTRIEVFAAHEGVTTYLKIWDVIYSVNFEEAWEQGWNALIPSTYNNGNNLPQDFWHRYDQLIFSKNFIPCPQV